MAKKEKYKEYAIWIVVGAIVMAAIAFMSLFMGQPKQFFCNSAELACNLSNQGLSVYDPTPYSDCDSCCPDEPQTCDGQLIPAADQRDYTSAEIYCAQFTDCHGTIASEYCLPVYGIQGMWTSCACQTSFA